MGKHGGKRPGAGRKKGFRLSKTIKEYEAKKLLIDKIMEHWEPLIDTQVKIALGEWHYETIDNVGNRRVYTAKPDSKAISSLLEIVVGKATQPIQADIEGEMKVPGFAGIAEGIKQILDSRSKALSAPIPLQEVEKPKPIEEKPPIPPPLKEPVVEPKPAFTIQTPPVVPEPPKPIEPIQPVVPPVNPMAVLSQQPQPPQTVSPPPVPTPPVPQPVMPVVRPVVQPIQPLPMFTIQTRD